MSTLSPTHNDDDAVGPPVGALTRWYAIFAKPRSEHKVAAALQAKGIDAYVPALFYHGKRGNTLQKPYFPRYLFAHFDWNDTRAAVQWTPGVARMVLFDGRPAWLHDKQIAQLKERLGEMDGDAFLRLKPGERVRVTAGNFKGFEAVFDKHLREDERVTVLLYFLGRQTRVEIPGRDLRRLS